MTALNAFVRADAAYILTDGGSYHTESGVLASIGSKTITSRRLRIAIGLSGFAERLRLRLFLAMMPDQATALAKLPAFMVASADRVRPKLASFNARFGAQFNLGNPLTVYVAVFDKAAAEPRIFQCGSNPRGLARIRVGLQPIIRRYEGLGALDLTHPLTFDVERDAVALVQAQRDRPLAKGENCMIGGFVELTRVDAAGVRSRVLHRWRDKVGQPINARKE